MREALCQMVSSGRGLGQRMRDKNGLPSCPKAIFHPANARGSAGRQAGTIHRRSFDGAKGGVQRCAMQ